MSKWKRVAEIDQLSPGVPIKVKNADDEEMLLVKTEEGIFAIGHECPHYGAPLSDGTVCGHVVTCPYHNARFDVRDGSLLTPPALDNLPQYHVKIEDGSVFVGSAITRQSATRKTKPDTGAGRAYVILGGGAAGNAAAEALRSEGYEGRIMMISADDSLPYDRPNLSKAYLAGEAEPEWMPLRTEEFYDNHRIDMMLETVIAKIDPADHTIETADGKQLRYDKLLLATGATPRVFTRPELQSDRLHYLRSLREADAIISAAEDAGRALVLGAGFIGLEVAASLTTRGIETHIAAPEEIPMSGALGEAVGRRFRRLHESNDVRFHMKTQARNIDGGTVSLSDGTTIEADLIVAGLGVEPAVACLDGTGLSGETGVKVDGTLRTKAEDIYAAGDIAAYPNHLTGDTQRIEHWSLAEMQGRHAAKSMLGSTDEFRETPFFWTRQFENSFKYIGHAAEWDDTVELGDVESGDFVVGYFKDDMLLGAVGNGMSEVIVHLSESMREGRSISVEDFKQHEQGETS